MKAATCRRSSRGWAASDGGELRDAGTVESAKPTLAARHRLESVPFATRSVSLATDGTQKKHGWGPGQRNVPRRGHNSALAPKFRHEGSQRTQRGRVGDDWSRDYYHSPRSPARNSALARFATFRGHSVPGFGLSFIPDSAVDPHAKGAKGAKERTFETTTAHPSSEGCRRLYLESRPFGAASFASFA